MTSVVHRIPGDYLDTADDQRYLLGCQFWFSSNDPAAVTVRCPQPIGEAVDWLFGRALLAHGLRAAAGLDAVHIEPCTGGEHIQLTAFFDTGLVVVRFPLIAVEAFLGATIAICALGEFAEEATYTEALAAEYAALMGEWPR